MQSEVERKTKQRNNGIGASVRRSRTCARHAKHLQPSDATLIPTVPGRDSRHIRACRTPRPPLLHRCVPAAAAAAAAPYYFLVISLAFLFALVTYDPARLTIVRITAASDLPTSTYSYTLFLHTRVFVYLFIFLPPSYARLIHLF